jgi:hypothetical protein
VVARRGFRLLLAWTLLGVAGAGCGGRSARTGTQSNGGNGGTGGNAAGGTGGGSCSYEGESYPVGASFPAGDDCNTCTCTDEAEILCTRTACTSCDELAMRYAAALVQAKRCDEALRVDPCTTLAASGLQCGCETFVAEGSELEALQHEWSDRGSCGRGVICGACPDPPVRGECSSDGVCVDIAESGAGGGGGASGSAGADGMAGMPNVPCAMARPWAPGIELCAEGYLHRLGPAECPEPPWPMEPAPAGGGEECNTDADCSPDTHCVAPPQSTTECLAAPCQSDADCGEGSACVCQPGYRLGETGEEIAFGRCVLAQCESDAGCPSGSLCVSAFDGDDPDSFRCDEP